MDSPDDGRRINSFSVIVKCGAVGEAVVAKNTSMSSLRRTRTGVGSGNMYSWHLK